MRLPPLPLHPGTAFPAGPIGGLPAIVGKSHWFGGGCARVAGAWASSPLQRPMLENGTPAGARRPHRAPIARPSTSGTRAPGALAPGGGGVCWLAAAVQGGTRCGRTQPTAPSSPSCALPATERAKCNCPLASAQAACSSPGHEAAGCATSGRSPCGGAGAVQSSSHGGPGRPHH